MYKHENKLYNIKNHPLYILKQYIVEYFSKLDTKYEFVSDLNPVVSVYENFDSLNFTDDHPGRSTTCT